MKYDADGNLTEDGTWQYQYDGENRLTKMINKSNNAYTLTFAYDYLGRRIRKTVANGPWGSTDTKFLWFGWNLAAELSADGVTPNKAFVWGPDFSDAHGNAGGAGSLLAQISGGVMNYAVPDTLGNIVAYTSNGTLSAAVEYSPFGRATTTYGSYSNFPMGYSGHYTDWETGLSYYGLRYYMPKHGRFINRDPSEEAGGTNLFAFTGNNPTNGWDVLGLLDDSADELPVFHVYGDPIPWDPIADYNNQRNIDFGNANLAQTLTPPIGYQGFGGNSGNGTGPSKGSGTGKGKGDGKNPSDTPCAKARAALVAAQNARGAYTGEGAPGWQKGQSWSNPDTGFGATVFTNPETGQAMLAFRGTDMFSGADWWTDYRQWDGQDTAQYRQAVNIAQQVYRTYGANASITGHSLGGGLASLSGLITGLPTFTFNASGLSPATMSRNNVSASMGGNIQAYYVVGEVLSTGQDLSKEYPAVGNRIGLAAVPTASNVLIGLIAPWALPLELHRINEVVASLQNVVTSQCGGKAK